MLTIKSIPAFNDNYIWLIHSPDNHCVVVDPGDATPVLAFLEQEQLELDAILITHHHHDHIGGISELKRRYPNIHIVAPSAEPIPGVSQSVDDGDQVEIFGERFMVLGVPGHTAGHVAYVGDGKLFCGDTLFSAGCGRLFEGTAEQMYNSLQKLSALPDETEVYCAHEYTSSNLAFALVAEQDNPHLQRYREEVSRMRAQGISTIPSTLKQEKLINPFLRCDQLSIKKSVANKAVNDSDVETFAALRRWKDEF
ncbi:hydroxyacylglutathione hydrolase [Photobacterium sp. BZF1]|uniref:Hydroxyacylglutathione hydrolase n=1 Tax=Photobacterium rosenbergii TaxID=294936 RepID=A0A2T3N3U0_9GAMM|nr:MULTISPECIES: hydroxyacylglutathione hydrolase [Photobacterium]MBC7002586.1 hydroxyacylglutathione hydrolase [Photobacterium sp. BZF1]MBY5948031.1 hydroxyacylglutathione hydrolase [Photobacterium rosenbergii]PSW07057.1 hydroxyacylglutathione hydrolase [Photobacterium rosenbergii]